MSDFSSATQYPIFYSYGFLSFFLCPTYLLNLHNTPQLFHEIVVPVTIHVYSLPSHVNTVVLLPLLNSLRWSFFVKNSATRSLASYGKFSILPFTSPHRHCPKIVFWSQALLVLKAISYKAGQVKYLSNTPYQCISLTVPFCQAHHSNFSWFPKIYLCSLETIKSRI